MTRSATSASPDETEALGAELARDLRPGDVVLVSGELGTGKTTLIRGACRALGVTGEVTSPTFTIGQRYQGRIPVSHLDLYRLDSAEAEDPGLLEEYFDPAGVCLVEWPEREGSSLAPALSNARIRVRMEHVGGDRRRIEIDP